jgi:hypothetical protein
VRVSEAESYVVCLLFFLFLESCGCGLIAGGVGVVEGDGSRARAAGVRLCGAARAGFLA